MNLPFVSIIQAALSAVVGYVFAASALPKLHHPRGFVLAVIEYRVLPPRLSWIAARAIPPLELLATLLLLTGSAVRVAATLLIALLGGFIVAIGINIARGRSLDCHCFGKAHSRTVGWRVLFEDALLLGACVVIAALTPNWGGLAPWSVFGYVGLARYGVVWPLLGLLALVACAAAVAPRWGLTRMGRRQRTGTQGAQPHTHAPRREESLRAEHG
jgi:uncharacterized membrane protein YphA (DoxX/SURF4 family)